MRNSLTRRDWGGEDSPLVDGHNVCWGSMRPRYLFDHALEIVLRWQDQSGVGRNATTMKILVRRSSVDLVGRGACAGVDPTAVRLAQRPDQG